MQKNQTSGKYVFFTVAPDFFLKLLAAIKGVVPFLILSYMKSCFKLMAVMPDCTMQNYVVIVRFHVGQCDSLCAIRTMTCVQSDSDYTCVKLLLPSKC